MSANSGINYVIQEPLELLDKLLFEAEKIVSIPNKNDFFNFVVTAAVLTEWICEHYDEQMDANFKNTMKGKSDTGLPLVSEDWIEDKTCLPNQHQGAVRHILNSIRICWHTTNATKHYKWKESSGIKSIGTEAKILNHYDYCFTSVENGIFIRYHDENYTIEQVKDILIQFYPNLISYLESIRNAPSQSV
ncbi:hypothetical protein L3V31_07485 [Vibrio sp. J1-1]|uniref:hypothetical protein n=1 Tax=Vibrio sp. J1-1 TaxID=2912251 RepID=UPI001F1B28B0|nr:hypothetical protein [Vibrio sp. J1-1]MCF7481569.1 hypothetical protein [Vibrio sp. J1-1]